MKRITKLFLILVLGLSPITIFAWPGMPTPTLSVSGKYLVDPCGNHVLLHGVAITPNPWFNGCSYGNSYCQWNNYDVSGCLTYMNATIDALTNTSNGWNLNYIRLHVDPYWTNNGTATSESDISKFDYNRLVTYTNSVIIPIINHATARGMYVILRPPGVCPTNIALNDSYYNYLVTVWTYLSQHASLKNNPNVMFELANEPINIKASDGTYGQDAQKYYDALKNFFQPMVNLIRNSGANNVIWVPGLGWQSMYKGLASNPVTGTNIGYAVHCYPGYWGASTTDATSFNNGWNTNVQPVANIAPIAVTEIDWAPSGYGAFGIATTSGFGTNFKNKVDAAGNVSWNVLGPDDLIDKGAPTGTTAYGNNWEACAAPCKSWFASYASSNLPSSTCSSGTSTSLVNNGIYTIEFKTDATKVIDLYNGTDADGTTLRPYTKNGATAQQWIAVSTSDGYWRFISNASTSKRCIDLESAATTNGTSIRLWSNYSDDAQAWQVVDAGSGYYKIVSKLNTSRGFDLSNCVVDGTQNLQLWDYYGTTCQLFKFNYISTKSSVKGANAGIDNTALSPSAETVSSSSFEVYPNPSANGNFTIALPNKDGESSRLNIFSLEGRKVYEKDDLKSGDNYISSALKTGVYILSVENNEGVHRKKIVVK